MTKNTLKNINLVELTVIACLNEGIVDFGRVLKIVAKRCKINGYQLRQVLAECNMEVKGNRIISPLFKDVSSINHSFSGFNGYEALVKECTEMVDNTEKNNFNNVVHGDYTDMDKIVKEAIKHVDKPEKTGKRKDVQEMYDNLKKINDIKKRHEAKKPKKSIMSTVLSLSLAVSTVFSIVVNFL